MLDPTVLSPHEIARLYARRWDFELAVKLVKRHLGLPLLWSAKPVVVQQQVWATLCIAQIVHALQLEIAGRDLERRIDEADGGRAVTVLMGLTWY